MNIVIRHQKRKSLAFKLSYDRAEVLIPHSLPSDHPSVEAFIADALQRLPAASQWGSQEPVNVAQLVEVWSVRLRVQVKRLQVRRMTRKWASMSSEGTLTLSKDVPLLPLDLAEYVIVHELLHLKFPNHARGWKISMSMHLPSWRKLEHQLQSLGTGVSGQVAI